MKLNPVIFCYCITSMHLFVNFSFLEVFVWCMRIECSGFETMVNVYMYRRSTYYIKVKVNQKHFRKEMVHSQIGSMMNQLQFVLRRSSFTLFKAWALRLVTIRFPALYRCRERLKVFPGSVKGAYYIKLGDHIWIINEFTNSLWIKLLNYVWRNSVFTL